MTAVAFFIGTFEGEKEGICNIPNSAQGVLLALCWKVTLGDALGTLCGDGYESRITSEASVINHDPLMAT